jgi:hypothetical protein
MRILGAKKKHLRQCGHLMQAPKIKRRISGAKKSACGNVDTSRRLIKIKVSHISGNYI